MTKRSNNIRLAAPVLTGRATVQESSMPADFLQWYTRFLVKELRPTAPYQTHIAALSLIQGFFQSFPQQTNLNNVLRLVMSSYERYISLFKQLSRTLLDLLLDPFDDVRQISTEILELLVESEFRSRTEPARAPTRAANEGQPTLTIIDQILDCVPKAKRIFQQSARADQADGLGRLLNITFGLRRSSSNLFDQLTTYHNLEYKLQRDIDVAAEDLDRAVRTAPLHGHLKAMRYMQDALRNYSTKVYVPGTL